ncbi:MAG: tripartite tricarboxylate transporter substrate binding protein [Rhodocyclaceae bacterium]|nr:tripartite tricarboxylate transporter substrate binding protein [Rhodocyclaceae bacterium]
MKACRMKVQKVAMVISTVLSCVCTSIACAWEPDKAVEIIVPNGIGGGSDQMARKILEIVERKKLAVKGIKVSNLTLGSGGEGFLETKNKWDDGHVVLLGASSLFTLPIERNLPVSFDEFKPVRNMGMDVFIVWVQASSNVKTVKDFNEAMQGAGGRYKLGGTQKFQEDHILGMLIKRQNKADFGYVPYLGGGAVANGLAAGEVFYTLNNPSEAVRQWKENKVRPVCLLDDARLTHETWKGVPTCREQGLDVSYRMMRGIFAPPSSPRGAVAWWQGVLAEVAADPAWKKFLADSAIEPSEMSGSEFKAWLNKQGQLHRDLMLTAFPDAPWTKRKTTIASR